MQMVRLEAADFRGLAAVENESQGLQARYLTEYGVEAGEEEVQKNQCSLRMKDDVDMEAVEAKIH
jgi:hypothetical protein